MSDRKEQQQGDPGAVPGASTTTKGLKTQGECGTVSCTAAAEVTAHWPGRSLAVCRRCAMGLKQLGSTMGFHLAVEPLVDTLVVVDVPEDPWARMEERFRGLEQLVRDSARAIDQLLAGHRAVSDEEAEALVPVPLRPGICSTCANGGVETVLGAIWCPLCDGARCSRCCGSENHRLVIERIERIKRPAMTIGVLKVADRYEGRVRLWGEQDDCYVSVGNRSPEEAWEHVASWVESSFEGVEWSAR